MIYLIQSAYIDDNDNFHKVLKIGYAKDIDKRLIAYYTHSPNIKLLDSREGDEELEKDQRRKEVKENNETNTTNNSKKE